jgi:glucose-1-phosphate thymidylyltransferase
VKGIVLAGGTGSRLWPATKSVSKQLLPVYDKPMIYYPISTLMLAGVREILIITTPNDQKLFQDLLGDGSKFGVSFSYEIQPKPEGLAQALIIGEQFLQGQSCLLVLGDNIFHGTGMGNELFNILPNSGAHVFTYKVSNPSDYGILEVDKDLLPISIEEKPKKPLSNYAVTGLYFFDNNGPAFAREVTPSQRGELEITSVIEKYLQAKKLTFTVLGRGVAWLDTGTLTDLTEASTYIRVIEGRTGLKIACLEEIALEKEWIDKNHLSEIAKNYGAGQYADYLKSLAASI